MKFCKLSSAMMLAALSTSAVADIRISTEISEENGVAHVYVDHCPSNIPDPFGLFSTKAPVYSDRSIEFVPIETFGTSDLDFLLLWGFTRNAHLVNFGTPEQGMLDVSTGASCFNGVRYESNYIIPPQYTGYEHFDLNISVTINGETETIREHIEANFENEIPSGNISYNDVGFLVVSVSDPDSPDEIPPASIFLDGEQFILTDADIENGFNIPEKYLDGNNHKAVLVADDLNTGVSHTLDTIDFTYSSANTLPMGLVNPIGDDGVVTGQVSDVDTNTAVTLNLYLVDADPRVSLGTVSSDEISSTFTAQIPATYFDGLKHSLEVVALDTTTNDEASLGVVDFTIDPPLPEGAAAPFVGNWDYFNESRNRNERTLVYVEGDQLLMRENVHVGLDGRITFAGSAKSAEYTESYFGNIELNSSSLQSRFEIASESEEVESSYTVDGRVYRKVEDSPKLCGGAAHYASLRNRLIHAPIHSEEAKQLDQCAQRMGQILNRQRRSGSELSIHRMPLYLLYRADLELSNGDTAEYEKFLNKARLLIDKLDGSPDLTDVNDPMYRDFNNIAIAISKESMAGMTISLSSGRDARRVMAYGSLVNEENFLSETPEVVLEAINDAYNAAVDIRSNSPITEVSVLAGYIRDFIKGADTRANAFVQMDGAPRGEPFVELLTQGDTYLNRISNGNFKLGFLHDGVSELLYRDHFFISHANTLQRYINENPSFSYSKFNVHHAIEKNREGTRYLGKTKLQSLINLRGIPGEINSELHLKKIFNCWNQLYNTYPAGTDIPQGVLEGRAKYIDGLYGHLFLPRIRPVPPQGPDYMPDCEAP